MTGKKHDGVEVLSRVSGLSRDQVAGEWQKVQENQKRLDSCDLHDFPWPPEPGARQLTCARCGGWMHMTKVLAYRLGLGHGIRLALESPIAARVRLEKLT